MSSVDLNQSDRDMRSGDSIMGTKLDMDVRSLELYNRQFCNVETVKAKATKNNKVIIRSFTYNGNDCAVQGTYDVLNSLWDAIVTAVIGSAGTLLANPITWIAISVIAASSVIVWASANGIPYNTNQSTSGPEESALIIEWFRDLGRWFGDLFKEKEKNKSKQKAEPQIVVAIQKFSEYALKPGNSKAPIFKSLGYDISDANDLVALYYIQGKQNYFSGKYINKEPSIHGQHIEMNIALGKNGITGVFRTGWIIEQNGAVVRLVAPFSGNA